MSTPFSAFETTQVNTSGPLTDPTLLEQNNIAINFNEISKPAKTKLIEILSGKDVKLLFPLPVLKVLSQGLNPSAPQNAFTFTFTRKLPNLHFENVQVSEKSNTPEQLAVVNALQTGYSVNMFIQAIDEKLNYFANIVNYLTTTSLFSEEYPTEGSERLRFMVLHMVEYLQRIYKKLLQDYKTLLHAITLHDIVSSVNNLSLFLTKLRGLDYTFYTMNAVGDILPTLQQSAIKLIPGESTWFACVNELLPQPPQVFDNPEALQALQILHDYFVGYYLTNDMCREIQAGWFQHFSFRQLVDELITTKNASHKAFFQTFLQEMTSACRDQSKNTGDCQARMNQSKSIMDLLANLYNMLQTWQIPQQQTSLNQIPSNAKELILVFEQLKINYLTAFVPNYGKTYASSIKELLSTISSYLPTGRNLVLLSVTVGAAAGLYQYGGDIANYLMMTKPELLMIEPPPPSSGTTPPPPSSERPVPLSSWSKSKPQPPPLSSKTQEDRQTEIQDMINDIVRKANAERKLLDDARKISQAPPPSSSAPYWSTKPERQLKQMSASDIAWLNELTDREIIGQNVRNTYAAPYFSQQYGDEFKQRANERLRNLGKSVL